MGDSWPRLSLSHPVLLVDSGTHVWDTMPQAQDTGKILRLTPGFAKNYKVGFP